VIQATNSDITFGGNAVNFTSNTANYGGAIALSDGGSIEFTGDEAIFRNNSATGEGGAIYAEGKAGNTDKTILSVLNGNLIFEGNNANGTANDIYLGENINFELRTGSNSVVSMDGGIKGLENSMFTKTGSGKMELLNGSINKYYGEFKIEQGIVEVNETAEATFGKLNIEANGIYSLVNGNAQQVTTAGEAKINGTLEIDVDFDNNIADILKAKTDTMQGASGKIIIGNTGKLGVNIIGTDEETMRITIIEGNIGSNRFTNDNPFIVSGYTKTPGGYNYTLDYFTDHIDVVKSKGTTLRTIAGLTHNQAEVAKIADKISDSSHRRGEFVEIINRIEAMTDNNAKKKALNEMSGSVIANILSAGVYDNEELFSRIQPQTKETSKKVWGQVYTYGRTNNADENSTEDFSISGYGIEAGADLISAESIVAGVYGLYENSSGEQGESKGDIGALGIGVYGGWFGENLDIKARIYGGKLQYKIDRALETLGEKAESETDGYNLKWDILGQYNIWYKEGLSIAPYGQIKSGYAMNSGTKEKGRDGENIEIYDETYLRVEGRIGVGINYAINRLNLYGKISAGFIAAGDKAQYKGEFLDSAEEMEIWGADAGKINGGLGLGASYEITNSWNAYANINGNYSENSKEYFANIGVNYAF
jgi:predicted outer membrane repeat protein